MEQRHISLGSIDQRYEIDIVDNIWVQEAHKFLSFPDKSELYKAGYWNGTGEKLKK